MLKHWIPPDAGTWIDTRGSWLTPPKTRYRSYSGVAGGGWAITIDTAGVDMNEAKQLLACDTRQGFLWMQRESDQLCQTLKQE
ncbi:MAG: hypothetical protein WC359_13890 [Dehalococcoidia bacterium]